MLKADWLELRLRQQRLSSAARMTPEPRPPHRVTPPVSSPASVPSTAASPGHGTAAAIDAVAAAPLLAQALDQLPHPTYLKSADQRLLWVNQAFCQFFGTCLDRCCNQPEAVFLNTLIAPAGDRLTPEAGAATAGVPITEERTVTNAQGDPRTLVVRATWCEDANLGGYWLISLTDVTELKAETQELRRMARLSEVASQAVNEGLWEIEIAIERQGVSTYSVWWSRQFRQLLGYSDETEFPNQLSSWISAMHPDDREWVLAALKAHLKDASGTTPFDVEYRMFTKGETLRWFRSVSRSLVGDIGSSRRMVGMLRDITDRKVAEAEVKHQQNILRAVLDNIPHRVWLQDKAGRYLAANRPFCEAWQRSPAEVLGTTDEALLPPDKLSVFRQEDEAIMASGQPLMVEEELVTADGKTHWFSTIKTPFLDENGVVIGLTGISMDITERKRAEEAVRQANEELEQRVEQRTAALQRLVTKLQREVSDRQKAEAALRQSEAELRQKARDLQDTLQQLQSAQTQLVQSEKMSSLGQLVAGVAHEINNPINFVYGNLVHANNYTQDLLTLLGLYQKHYAEPHAEIVAQAQMMDLDFVLEDLPKLLKSMYVGAERIQEIVRSLRSFSRMDEAEFKAVDVHEGIDSTLLILQNRLKACAPAPEVQVIKDYGELPPVECYASQMNQVFMNILTNALDALAEEAAPGAGQATAVTAPRIQITTRVCGPNRVAIAFADNGPGIPEDLQTRIFDPFFTTKPVGQGTGLGMSISYQIVTERHRGTLTCHGNAEGGTTFVVEIPIRQRAVAPHPEPEGRSPTTETD